MLKIYANQSKKKKRKQIWQGACYFKANDIQLNHKSKANLLLWAKVVELPCSSRKILPPMFDLVMIAYSQHQMKNQFPTRYFIADLIRINCLSMMCKHSLIVYKQIFFNGKKKLKIIFTQTSVYFTSITSFIMIFF